MSKRPSTAKNAKASQKVANQQGVYVMRTGNKLKMCSTRLNTPIVGGKLQRRTGR